MHEMGIAYSVLAAVRTEAARCPDKAPRKVGVRIGEMSRSHWDKIVSHKVF